MGNAQEKATRWKVYEEMDNAQEKPTEGGPSSTASDNQKKEDKKASDIQKTETESPVQTYGDGKSKWCMVYAKALDITWSGDTRYWRWVKETSGGDSFLAAELLNVCWLEVSGKLATDDLSKGTRYEVVFVVKMKTKAYGWDAPVNFKFTPPDGTGSRIKPVNLMDTLKDSKDQWKDIPFGEFTAPENPGKMDFSLYEYGGRWKSGLVIKGVAVRPKS